MTPSIEDDDGRQAKWRPMSERIASSEVSLPPPSALAGKTVLVTGGAGLVGRRLVAALSPIADVRVLDHFHTSDPSVLPQSVQIFRGDVGDQSVLRQAIDGVDVVFHQAATSGPYAIDHPVESHTVNTTATLQLLERARARNVRTVVASSAAIYGPTESVPISEDATKTPLNPYGLQKLTADAYARQYHDLYGLETVVLRYFNVYGYRPQRSRRKNVVNIFIEQARAGTNLGIKGEGKQRRDFVHVDDVVQANILAAVTSHVGSAFNIGTGVGTEISALAKLVQQQAGDVDISRSESRLTDVAESVADLTNARQQLGYAPTVRIEDGIAALWEAYRQKKDTST